MAGGSGKGQRMCLSDDEIRVGRVVWVRRLTAGGWIFAPAVVPGWLH